MNRFLVLAVAATLAIGAPPALAKSGWQDRHAEKDHRTDRGHRWRGSDDYRQGQRWRDAIPGSGYEGGPPAPGAFWRN